jgi:tetratricopeptide (TPR) repeat protein
MDFATLFFAFSMVMGLVTFDTIRTSDRAVVEVAPLPKLEKVSIDQVTVEQEFAEQLNKVARVASIVIAPEIRRQTDVGVVKAISNMLRIADLTNAVEADLGYASDRMRLALFTDEGKMGAVISGTGKRVGRFRVMAYPTANETFIEFVRRCSLVGASHLAPYGTALYLVQNGARGGDVAPAKRLAERAIAALPDTPESFERSLLENVQGLAALIEKDLGRAHAIFRKATLSSPRNSAAILNLAFVDIQMGKFDEAEVHIREMMAEAAPENPVLHSTALMTQAAALIGMGRPADAALALSRATEVNPDNSSAWYLWGRLRESMGDRAAGAQLIRRAYQSTDALENYAEVAVLYFALPYKPGMGLTESPFRNPEVLPGR